MQVYARPRLDPQGVREWGRPFLLAFFLTLLLIGMFVGFWMVDREALTSDTLQAAVIAGEKVESGDTPVPPAFLAETAGFISQSPWVLPGWMRLWALCCWAVCAEF